MSPATLELAVEKGPRAGELITCSTGGAAVRIGRVVRGNTFAIKDPGISQKHLLIEFSSESSGWLLTDLNTSNGTLINERSVAPTVPTLLAAGDIIRIGEQTTMVARTIENSPVPDVEVEAEPQRRRTRASTRAQSTKVVDKSEPSDRFSNKRPGRGRRAARVLKLSTIEENEERNGEKLVPDLEELEIKENVDLGKKKERRGVNRTSSNSVVDEEQVAKLEQMEDEMSKKDEKLEQIEDGNSRKDDKLEVGLRGRGRGRGRVRASSSRNSSASVLSEAVEIPAEKGELIKVEEEEKEVEMEKMTLEEWFVRVENYLQRVIYETSEEIITDLRENAARCREYIEDNDNSS